MSHVDMVSIPRDELLQAIKVLRHGKHPMPSPLAEKLDAYLRSDDAMTTPTLRAIKCSERMPTREDADAQGFVHWIVPIRDCGSGEGRFDNPAYFGLATHWFSLNRSAIATGAEEQT